MAPTTLQQRMQIREMASAGASDRQIAEHLNCSIHTVRKWRRRAARMGPAGLATRAGRPASGALSTFGPLVPSLLAQWRQDHPGWGAATLRAELARCPALSGLALPSRASIARWLHAAGLTRRYQRRRTLPQPPPQPLSAPHQVWELDGEGYRRVPEIGMVSLLNLTDRFSRAKLLSYPCFLGIERVRRHPTSADYQLVLRQAFATWGLPDRLAVDRDSIYYDNHSPSPFPTGLHLWLLALGVDVEIGRPGRPTDRAQIERSHQLWYHQVLDGQVFADLASLAAALEERRTFLNHCLPCTALAGQPPLVAVPEARHARRGYRPEWEAGLLDPGRIDAYLASGQWFRLASNRGALSLGAQRYVLGRAWARQEVAITFDPDARQLLCQTADGRLQARMALRGCTPAELMGEAAPVLQFDRYQLALPLTVADWRLLRFCETLGDTS